MLGQEMLNEKKWAVVGDVLNPSKFACIIKNRLIGNGYQVFPVNPRSQSPEVYHSLGEIKEGIDVIDLCINPHTGLDIVKEAAALGIEKIFIQPGAESEEIIDFCKEKNLQNYLGCVLVELSKRGM
ncbi:putative CoA-binding protein [Anaerosolibacter carboniphilus]|uniref:Putative CoA-binding protein n=1 Tax=Anaerosolibacter carboniphilus TaxID=1417629 RepID=A0A841L3N2_9FIRM|nr:CoA-binding protein [Anaerosolibacter carboniphilus]MBB6217742.1 putative CoA-binding protein [Anaerosolibacter carboniphilus]